MIRKFVFAALLAMMPLAQLARAQAPQAPVLPSADPAFEQRIKLLETELRCLVCQNQTIAESPAGLADDLRREIRGLAQQGKTDAEIKQFLQTRYGDFILYKPQLKESTWLLWGGPFALFVVGVGIFGFIVSRRKLLKTAEVDPAALQRAEQLLAGGTAPKD
jgi:cytochrome c-type biogenesis protein CcmH